MKIVLLTTDNRDHQRCYTEIKPRFGTAPEALLQGFALLPEVEVHVVTCTQQPMQSPRKIAGNIFYHSLLVPKSGWLRSGYLGCIRAVRRKLREIQPDIVHGQGTERDCAMEAIFSGYRNVITIHGNMRAMAQTLQAPPFSFYWCAALLERIALRKTEGVFCNSQYTESLVAPISRKTWRVANALRSDFFLPPPPASSNSNLTQLLNIGVISPHKQQLELIRHLQSLHQSIESFQLLFIGHCDPQSAYGKAFLEYVRQPDVASWVRYSGPLEIQQLIQRLDESQALIHCPREEAFGLVVAEALARNKKVFATNVGGIPDILQGMPMSELHDLGKWDDLADAIRIWIKAGAPQPVGCQEKVKLLYHPNVIAARHLELYEEVLGKVSGKNLLSNVKTAASDCLSQEK